MSYSNEADKVVISSVISSYYYILSNTWTLTSDTLSNLKNTFSLKVKKIWPQFLNRYTSDDRTTVFCSIFKKFPQTAHVSTILFIWIIFSYLRVKVHLGAIKFGLFFHKRVKVHLGAIKFEELANMNKTKVTWPLKTVFVVFAISAEPQKTVRPTLVWIQRRVGHIAAIKYSMPNVCTTWKNVVQFMLSCLSHVMLYMKLWKNQGHAVLFPHSWHFGSFRVTSYFPQTSLLPPPLRL